MGLDRLSNPRFFLCESKPEAFKNTLVQFRHKGEREKGDTKILWLKGGGFLSQKHRLHLVWLSVAADRGLPFGDFSLFVLPTNIWQTIKS